MKSAGGPPEPLPHRPAAAARLRALVWLLPPLALGVFVRLFRLASQPLFGDELHAVRAMLDRSLREILTTYLAADPCIPLAALDKLLSAGGRPLSELDFLLPPTIAGLALLVLAPLLLERRLGHGAGLFAAWLLALSPDLVLYSRIARPYMPLALLGFGALFAFDAWWRSGRHRWAVLYVLCSALAAWLHLGVAPFVAAPFLFALVRKAVARGEGRSLAGLAVVAAGLAAGVAAFVLPAWSSFLAFLHEKPGASRPGPAVLARALQLHAGATLPAAAVVFWLLAAAGLLVLARRRPRFALLTGLATGAELAGMWTFAPVGLGHPVIFGRYLLVGLPFVLAWVAAALAELAGSSWGKGRALPRLAAWGLVAVLVLCGPLARPRFFFSSFLTDTDGMTFYRPPPAMAAPDLVPAFYRKLTGSADGGAVVECTCLPTWSSLPNLFAYQEIHHRRVLLAIAEPRLLTPQLAWRSFVSPEPAALAAAPARWAVVHLSIGRELDRAVVSAPPPLFRNLRPAGRRLASLCGRELRKTLTRAWGRPDYVDGVIAAWDLERVRRELSSRQP